MDASRERNLTAAITAVLLRPEIQACIRAAAESVSEGVSVTATDRQVTTQSQSDQRSNSDDDFELPTARPSQTVRMLPSRFTAVAATAPRPAAAARRRRCGRESGSVMHTKNYQKVVVCFEHTADLPLAIPRGTTKVIMESAGLVHNLMWTNQDSAAQMKALITNVYRGAFGLQPTESLHFTFMSTVPGCRRLQLANPSQSFEWTGEAVAKVAGQGCLYLMADSRHKLVAKDSSTESDEDFDGDLPDITLAANRDQQSVTTEASSASNRHRPPLSSTRPQVQDVQAILNTRQTYAVIEEEEPHEQNLDHPVDNSARSREEITVQQLQVFLMNSVVDNNRQKCLVLRQSRAFQDFKLWMSRPGWSVRHPIRVQFMGQTGIDDKGLTRQLATYLIRGLADFSLFVGQAGRFTLTDNLAQVTSGECRSAGQMVAFIICHAGLTCPLFSPTFVRYLCRDNAKPDIRDVPDECVAEKIRQVQSSDTFPSAAAAELAEEVHFYNMLTRDKKQLFLDAAVAYYITGRNRMKINAFEEGLGETDVPKLLEGNTDAALGLLSGDRVQPLTADSLYDMFVPDLSALGSNNRALEEEALLNFRLFLEECCTGEIGCSLEDVLEFASGARAIPPAGLHGFNSVPTIQFANEGFPFASTCAITITLPRTMPVQVASFTQMMVTAVLNSPQFDE